MAPAPGARLGPYELLQVVGTGGMGDVYAARDLQLKRQVAIKVLPDAVAANPVRLARFEREAQLASALNHPNIVTIYGIGREEAITYIAMELIDGQTLKSAAAGAAWPLARKLDVAAQIASGLAKAHEAGIVHRDLKPQNVMITRDGLVKLLDFGLSTAARAGDPDAVTTTDAGLTMPGAIMGTAPYMSPEQAAGQAVDFRSDQFSFGSLFYELLAGQRPFDAPSVVQTLSAVIQHTPRPIAELNPDVPESVAAIVDRCLAKSPRDRYGSTLDLARDVQNARDQAASSTTTRRLGVVRQPGPRRVRWAAGLIGIGCVGALAAAIAFVPAVRRHLSWSTAPAHQQIAVLPFTNIGDAGRSQPFADGLVEILTAQLTQMTRFDAALEVVPASDVRTEQTKSARDARQAFHVTRVVTGSVQEIAGATRVTVNLVDADSLRQLESRTVDLRQTNVESMQDAVVREVAAMLGASVRPDAEQSLLAGGTKRPAAYQAYVEGRGYLRRFEQLESIDLAIASFRRAVGDDPAYVLAHAGLAEAYWRRYELTKETQWIESARASCATALGLSDRIAAVHVTLGIIDRGTGEFDAAIRELRRAIALDPLEADAYRELANAYQAIGRPADTESTYKAAIDVRPTYWENYNALGAFYRGQARYADAEAQFKKALELTPDNTRVLSNLGALYLQTQRYDEAASAFQRSIQVKPTASAYSNLGTDYFYLGRYRDAARQFEQAIKLGRNNSTLLKNLASAYTKVPEERAKAPDAFKAALAAVDRELAVNPHDASLLLRAAECAADLGERALARTRVDEALRASPDNVDIQVSAGNVYETLGDRPLAIKLIRTALDHGYSRDLIDRDQDLAALRADPRFTAR